MSSQMLIANKVSAADEDGSVEGGDRSIEKCGKLWKTRKLSKSWKLAKLRKKLSKSGNLPNFNAKENGPSFLTPDVRIAFNCLWLAFTKALILRHFHPKWYIWIEIDALGYAIGGVLS